MRLTWSQPLTDSDARPGGWTLGFEQPLLKGFGAEVDTAAQRIARISEEQNILALRDTIARTIVSVIREYRSVIRAHRALAISREALSRAERQLETNRSLVGVGRMAANEVIPTEAEVANRQLALADSENGVVSANAALISILDIDTATRVHPAEELPSVEEVRPDLERNIETAFANRSDYLRALMDREVAETNLRVAKDARRWDLRLQATTSRNRGGEHNYAVGLGLAIPLGDQAPKLRVLRAKGSLRKAAIAIVELRQSTRIAIRQASHNAEVGFRRVALARRVRELAQRKVDVEQEKLARGLTSTIQLSAVEDDFVRAQTGELDSIISYLNALTSLDQAMGTTLRTWGVDIDSISLRDGDTALISQGGGTFASRTAVTGSMAIDGAARKLRDKAIGIAARIHGLDPSLLTIVDGAVRDGSGREIMTLAEVARTGHRIPGADSSQGTEAGLEAINYFASPTVTWSSGTHIATVEVDRDTGHVTLDRYVIVHDAGNIINPAVVEGQIVGGVVHGIGNALSEEAIYDEVGNLQTSSFVDYRLPRALDVPPIEVHHQEFPTPLNELGIKGCGEGGTVGAPAAIVNAVEDALHPLDLRITEMPLQPEKLLRYIRTAEAAASALRRRFGLGEC